TRASPAACSFASIPAPLFLSVPTYPQAARPEWERNEISFHILSFHFLSYVWNCSILFGTVLVCSILFRPQVAGFLQ
ncbi:MAG: hypothetical protein KAI82_10965, partial [Tritonibacter mobilis]|nr:hypothetical protein [Tritonibacter mobilis]